MLTVRNVAVTSAIALLAAPALVAAPAGAVPTVPTVPTEISIIVADKVDYGESVTIGGQVSYVDPDDGEEYGLADATVVLERRYLDSTEWEELGTQVTAGMWPDYEFEVTARKGARYRVSYAGDATYLPSKGEATVRVHRKITSKLTEPRTNVFFLKGRVTPKYAGEPVALLRKKCETCSWKAIQTVAATAKSTYRFRLPLPGNGTHYFRARTPATVLFLKTVSHTWEIRRIR